MTDASDPTNSFADKAVRCAPVVRSSPNAPALIQVRNGQLRLARLDGDWGAPAALVESIDLACADLAVLKLILWLAFPSPAGGKTRASAARKILQHWRANVSGEAGDTRRRDRIGAIRKVDRLASARVCDAGRFMRALTLAACVRHGRSGISYRGPDSVNAISKRLAAANAAAKGREPGRSSHKTVLGQRWSAAKPILHLADAVANSGGVDALIADGLKGDSTRLARLLERAESGRRLWLPMIGVSPQTMIQFRPIFPLSSAYG